MEIRLEVADGINSVPIDSIKSAIKQENFPMIDFNGLKYCIYPPTWDYGYFRPFLYIKYGKKEFMYHLNRGQTEILDYSDPYIKEAIDQHAKTLRKPKLNKIKDYIFQNQQDTHSHSES